MFSTARDLPFRHSLPEFQRLFPDDAACAAYLEKARWGDGFACPHCGTAGEPFHFENRPGVLRCRKCRQNTGLTVGTVMERSHTPLNVWFWAAYLVASQTPGMSAVQFQRQLGLSRYETAFQILHKLRSGMVRPNQDRIGGQPKNHVEVDETWVGGRTRGEGRIVDGGKGLEAALASLWSDIPVQRCTVHKERNLLAHAPKALHDEVKADYTDMMYAENAEQVRKKRKAFLAKWRRPNAHYPTRKRRPCCSGP